MAIGKKTSKKRNIKKAIGISVLICILLSCLSSCGYHIFSTVENLTFNSQLEFIEFIEKYSSKNDGFVPTFIYFDLSNKGNMELYKINLSLISTYATSKITGETKCIEELYDENHKESLGVEMIFYYHDNTNEYQITCDYETNNNQHFYHDDEIDIELKRNLERQNIKYRLFKNFRSNNGEKNSEYNEYYDYLYQYIVSIQNDMQITINVCSKSEPTQENIDEICQMLIDNIMMINTEG